MLLIANGLRKICSKVRGLTQELKETKTVLRKHFGVSPNVY